MAREAAGAAQTSYLPHASAAHNLKQQQKKGSAYLRALMHIFGRYPPRLTCVLFRTNLPSISNDVHLCGHGVTVTLYTI